MREKLKLVHEMFSDRKRIQDVAQDVEILFELPHVFDACGTFYFHARLF